MWADLAGFPVLRVRVALTASGPVVLRGFTGNAFRVALGAALHRVVCGRSGLDCRPCPSKDGCAFVRVFRTSSLHRVLGAGRRVTPPAPFAIDPPVGSALRFAFTLIGPAIDDAPTVIAACRGMELGKEKVSLALESAEYVCRRGPSAAWIRDGGGLRPLAFSPTLEESADLAPPTDGTPVRISLVTAMQIRRMVNVPRSKARTPAKEVSFRDLVESAVRRARLLAEAYGMDLNLPEMDDAVALSDRFGVLESHQHFERREVGGPRRQHPAHGVTGHLTVAGPWAALWPLLRLAEQIHVGAGASRGLGRIKLSVCGKETHEAATRGHLGSKGIFRKEE